MPRSGLKTLISKVVRATPGTTTIIAAVGAGKRIRLHSLYGVSDADGVGTYSRLYFWDSAEQPFAEFIAAAGFAQVLKDAAAPPLDSYAPNAELRLFVEAVVGNGFADVNAWVWGVYEVLE